MAGDRLKNKKSGFSDEENPQRERVFSKNFISTTRNELP